MSCRSFKMVFVSIKLCIHETITLTNESSQVPDYVFREKLSLLGCEVVKRSAGDILNGKKSKVIYERDRCVITMFN